MVSKSKGKYLCMLVSVRVCMTSDLRVRTLAGFVHKKKLIFLSVFTISTSLWSGGYCCWLVTVVIFHQLRAVGLSPDTIQTLYNK